MLKRTLTIIDSSGNMSEIDLNQFGKTLLYMGRDESKCDIIIADPIVSKIHGTFQLEHSYLLYRFQDSETTPLPLFVQTQTIRSVPSLDSHFDNILAFVQSL